MMAAFLADDLTDHLLTLLWPLVVIWVYKMVDRGRVGKRQLCRSQINSKNAMVSQTIDQLEEVTVKAVLTVLVWQGSFSKLIFAIITFSSSALVSRQIM